jgi:cytochrome b pre-mRNA-processing protein 3
MSIKQGRTFMTTTSFYAKPSSAEDDTSLNVKAAAGLKKAAGRATQSYTAYGMTEQLYKECSKQADYTVSQAAKKDAEMPKTEEGEDLGVGEGWWHTG